MISYLVQTQKQMYSKYKTIETATMILISR